MTASAATKKISSFASGSFSAIRNAAIPIWKILTFDFSEIVLPRKCLSISIEQSGFSVAYVTKALSRFRVRGIKKYLSDSTYPDPEYFASSVALAITELGGGKSEVTLSIPKSWAIIKAVEFPASVKENLSNVISYEMDRITPFNSEDALYDFKIINEINGHLNVLLAVTKEQLIQPYLDALAGKGIIVSKLTLNISAVESLLGYMDGQTTNLFIEIDESSYEGALFADSLPTNSFAAEFKASEERSQLRQILDEISHIIDEYKKDGASLQIYILFKNKGSSFKEMFKAAMTMPFKILNEIDTGISFTEARDIISYPAIGGALETLWQKDRGLNLLSKGQISKDHKPLALTIILLIIIASIGILYAVAPLYVENKRVEELDRQIQARKDEVKKVEVLKKEIELINKDIVTIKSFKQDRHMTLNILKEFTSIVPKGTWLTRMRITDKTIEIEGYAGSATELLPKLEASKLLQKVEFASPTFRDARMNMDRFNIKMEIEGLGKEIQVLEKSE